MRISKLRRNVVACESFYFSIGTADLGVSRLVLHPSLPLYLDVRLLLPEVSGPSLTQKQRVGVYRRCLHCKGGLPGARWADWWTAGQGFTDSHAFLDEQLK